MDKLTYIQLGDYLIVSGLHETEEYGPVELQQDQDQKTIIVTPGLHTPGPTAIEQHRIIAVRREGKEVVRFETILVIPNNLLHTLEAAQEYAQKKIGQTLRIEVGDKYSALPDFYGILHYRIVDTDIEVKSDEPLEGKIIGACIFVDEMNA